MNYQAVFLDRDGVINRWRADYVKSIVEFELLPGVPEAIARLSAAGLPVVVITNQSVIGRGLVIEETLTAIHRHMLSVMAAAGGRITDVLYCPHLPADGCDCRKPKPGLLLDAARRHDLDLRRCVLVGDEPNDMGAAAAAGCPALLIGTAELPDLAAAVALILEKNARE